MQIGELGVGPYAGGLFRESAVNKADMLRYRVDSLHIVSESLKQQTYATWHEALAVTLFPSLPRQLRTFKRKWSIRLPFGSNGPNGDTHGVTGQS